MTYEELQSAIEHVTAMRDAGHKTSSVSGRPRAIMELGVKPEHCAMSATGGNLVCIMKTDSLLQALLKAKKSVLK